MPGGSLAEGAPADITILAPDLQVTIDGGVDALAIQEHAVRRLARCAAASRRTIVGGRVVYVNDDVYGSQRSRDLEAHRDIDG